MVLSPEQRALQLLKQYSKLSLSPEQRALSNIKHVSTPEELCFRRSSERAYFSSYILNFRFRRSSELFRTLNLYQHLNKFAFARAASSFEHLNLYQNLNKLAFARAASFFEHVCTSSSQEARGQTKPPVIGGLGGETLNPKGAYFGRSGAGIQIHCVCGLGVASPTVPAGEAHTSAHIRKSMP